MLTNHITSPTYELSDDEKRSFDENGYIGPVKVYEPDEMVAIWNNVRRHLLDRTHAVYPDPALGGVTNIANYDRHLDVELLADHICRAQIVDRVRSILGPNVLCWRTEFFPKYKGDEGTDWHQAATFANASGRPQILWPEAADGGRFGGTITVWTAFTRSTEQNGCLQLMPGTHRTMHYDESRPIDYSADVINKLEKGDVKRGFFGYDYRQLQIDPNWEPDESQAFPLVMEPGECVIFWSTVLHASLPHRSAARDYRMGFAARYVPDAVDIYPDTELVVEYGGSIPLDRYGAVVVAGENTNAHNRIVTETTRGHRFPVCR